MISNGNYYAALEEAPLETLAHLRSVSTEDDQEHVISRLLAQDDDTKSASNTTDIVVEHAGVTVDESAADGEWETVGPVKKGKKKSKADKVIQEPEDAQGAVAEAEQEAAPTVIYENEKEMPPGAPQVTEMASSASSVSDSDSDCDSDPEVSDLTPYTELEEAVEQHEEKPTAHQEDAVPAFIVVSLTDFDTSENTGAIIEPSPSIAPQESEDLVDTLDLTDTGDFETPNDLPTTPISSPGAGAERTWEVPKKTAGKKRKGEKTPRVLDAQLTTNELDPMDAMMPGDELLDAEDVVLEATEATDDVEEVPLKKKAKKRGKKGGKRVKKPAQATQDEDEESKLSLLHVALFVGLIGICAGLVGTLMKA